jgi:hypothetical protein
MTPGSRRAGTFHETSVSYGDWREVTARILDAALAMRARERAAAAVQLSTSADHAGVGGRRDRIDAPLLVRAQAVTSTGQVIHVDGGWHMPSGLPETTGGAQLLNSWALAPSEGCGLGPAESCSSGSKRQ